MSRNTQLFALIAALSIVPAAYAGDADVCYAPSFSPLDNTHPALDDSTVFKCPRAGAHTLPELAKDGWIVVQISAVTMPIAATSVSSHNPRAAISPAAERLIIRK